MRIDIGQPNNNYETGPCRKLKNKLCDGPNNEVRNYAKLKNSFKNSKRETRVEIEGSKYNCEPDPDNNNNKSLRRSFKMKRESKLDQK